MGVEVQFPYSVSVDAIREGDPCGFCDNRRRKGTDSSLMDESPDLNENIEFPLSLLGHHCSWGRGAAAVFLLWCLDRMVIT